MKNACDLASLALYFSLCLVLLLLVMFLGLRPPAQNSKLIADHGSCQEIAAELRRIEVGEPNQCKMSCDDLANIKKQRDEAMTACLNYIYGDK